MLTGRALRKSFGSVEVLHGVDIDVEPGRISVLIGPSGSGVPFHQHGPVFAEVFFGKKRWFLSDPGHKPLFDVNESSLRWLHEQTPAELEAKTWLLECTLERNQILWIPDNWWHATLNIGETVFISAFV